MITDILAQYGLFLLKVVTVVIAIAIVIGLATAAGKRGAQDGLEVENLNNKFRDLAAALRKSVLGRADARKEAKALKKRAPHIKTIVGGAIITAYNERFCVDERFWQYADYAMPGECDLSFPQFCTALENGFEPRYAARGALAISRGFTARGEVGVVDALVNQAVDRFVSLGAWDALAAWLPRLWDEAILRSNVQEAARWKSLILAHRARHQPAAVAGEREPVEFLGADDVLERFTRDAPRETATEQRQIRESNPGREKIRNLK